jgi:hypothetical protein
MTAPFTELRQAINDAKQIDEYFKLERRLNEIEGIEYESKTAEAAKNLLEYLYNAETNMWTHLRKPQE